MNTMLPILVFKCLEECRKKPVQVHGKFVPSSRWGPCVCVLIPSRYLQIYSEFADGEWGILGVFNVNVDGHYDRVLSRIKCINYFYPAGTLNVNCGAWLLWIWRSCLLQYPWYFHNCMIAVPFRITIPFHRWGDYPGEHHGVPEILLTARGRQKFLRPSAQPPLPPKEGMFSSKLGMFW